MNQIEPTWKSVMWQALIGLLAYVWLVWVLIQSRGVHAMYALAILGVIMMIYGIYNVILDCLTCTPQKSPAFRQGDECDTES